MEKSSSKRVQQAIRAKGFSFEVVELPDSTRSAKEASAAIGCDVAEIAKSLIFKGRETGEAYLVIASGTNRVDESKISGLANEPIVKPDAGFVREQTGFAIGGVPPVGHARPLLTWIDEDLLQYPTIWAAAGTPFSVFRLNSDQLKELTGGMVAAVKETG